ncbi:hypothetical protein GJ744_010816 [Endocarpon pusillum]|uniref:Uncharacterized protein n=1 Tax=Endocarpon pusillum TaxID=364733 RepID=A0A8H7ADS6_9EURO|nr:hypothetical protein GJ744_010816 [Endocarpon pusillum]
MATEIPRGRRAPANSVCSNPPSPQAPRGPQTILDTPRRLKLLADARTYAGKMPRKELFKIHNVAERTGYKILKQGTMRRGPGIHNRGRKRILEDRECAATAVRDIIYHIQDTAACDLQTYFRGLDTPYETLQAFKRRLAPTDRAQRLELPREYHALKRAPKSQSIDSWLQL